MVATRRRRSRTRPRSSFHFGAHAGRLLVSAALALGVFVFLLLADATGALPGPISPLHVFSAHADRANQATHLGPAGQSTATPTVSATATVTAAPTIELVSPAGGTGPDGAHVTVHGSNFTGGNAQLFGSSQPDCSSSIGVLATVGVSHGNISATFIWPLSYAPGTYYICTNGMSSSPPSYQVLSQVPPTLSLSSPSVTMGTQLTILGSSFVGFPPGTAVTVTEDSSQVNGAKPRILPVNAQLDGNGNFSVSWTVDGPYTGNVTIRAAAGAQNSAPAVLQASADVSVVAAATATVTVAPSPTTISIAKSSSSPGQSNGALGLIILLVTGIIITLVVIVGIVTFLALRRRRPADDQWRANGYGAPGGYGAPNGYGAPGGYSAPGGYGEYGNSGGGGVMMQPQPPYGQGLVSEWDDADPQPGANWQPHPMSGYYPDFDSNDTARNSSRSGAAYGPYDRYGPGPVDPDWSQPGPQGPIDPWNNPSGSYDTYPGGPERYGSQGGSTRSHPSRGGRSQQGRRPEADASGWDDQWPDLGGNDGNTWGR